MEIEGFEFPDDALYEDSGGYLWIKMEGDQARIGETTFGLALAGDIVYLELPGVGDSITKGEPFGVAETVKATAELVAPFNGEVTEVNEEAVDDPARLNEEGKNWFIVVKPEDTSGLMSADEAKEYYTNEIQKAKDEGIL
jgi:glycine cleavage system H protein